MYGTDSRSVIWKFLSVALVAFLGLGAGGTVHLSQSANAISSPSSGCSDASCFYNGSWYCTYNKGYDCHLYDTDGDGVAEECGTEECGSFSEE